MKTAISKENTMKKILKLYILTITIILLTNGCNKEEMYQDEPGVIEVISGYQNSVEDEEMDDENKELNHKQVGHGKKLLSDADGLFLFDFELGFEVARFEVDPWIFARQTFDLTSGYFGVLLEFGSSGRNMISMDADGNFEMTDFDDINEDIDEKLVFILFDVALNVVREIIVENDLIDTKIHMAIDAKMVHDEILLYFITDWIHAIITDEPVFVGRINLDTGFYEKITDLKDDYAFLQIAIINNSHLVVIGQNLQENNNEVILGIINVENREISWHTESNFPIHSNDRMITRNGIVLIREELMPPTMGTSGGISVARGEVLIIDTNRNTLRTVSVEGLESFWATLSYDGQSIISIDENLQIMRKYSVDTGVLLEQVYINISGDRILYIIATQTGSIGIRTFCSQHFVHHFTQVDF